MNRVDLFDGDRRAIASLLVLASSLRKMWMIPYHNEQNVRTVKVVAIGWTRMPDGWRGRVMLDGRLRDEIFGIQAAGSRIGRGDAPPKPSAAPEPRDSLSH